MTFDFADAFRELTGYEPLPWQSALHDRFVVGDFPASCNLPTGLGKTSVVAVWLIALANNFALVPRRLVYVVNRRTVVDQTTNEVEKLRSNLVKSPKLHDRLGSLAVSTLRGQFADNREWSADPSRPAVICGTVDMIGSRLLFSGYGCGFKSRPLQAGFLGHDSLLVHDEAHLEPAFQELLVAIEREQTREKPEFGSDCRIKVIELSATSRSSGRVFTLSAEDERNEVVRRRLHAKKKIRLHEAADEKAVPERVAELALEYQESKQAILVFVRTVEAVNRVAEKLEKAKQQVERLTGTLRGKERDALVEKPLFRRYLPQAGPGDETVYLVCTSAGEVGVNISADHAISDLNTFESMVQRLGRVNRFGEREDTCFHVVHPASFDDKSELEARRERTLALLRHLESDGSSKALGKLDPLARAAAFSPQPQLRQTSEILFDAWALTSARDRLPGRPPVEEYLHGVSEWEPPETAVAWRNDVEVVTGELLEIYHPEDLLDDYPLKPHELLRVRSSGKGGVFEHLEAIAERNAQRADDQQLSAWIIDSDGIVTVHPLSTLARKNKLKKPMIDLGGCTLILPPAAGGLRGGLLNGASAVADDVADDWLDENNRPRRCRAIWGLDEAPPKMRLVRSIDTRPESEDDSSSGSKRVWFWYVRPMSADDDGSKTAERPITLQHHTDDVVQHAMRIVTALDLPTSLRTAIQLAAKFHDVGKKRLVWQRSIGNPHPTDWYAKSGRAGIGKDWQPIEITGFRHEFGSLIDVQNEAEFQRQAPDVQELILHLIAVHHGRGRPHFPAAEVFDPEHTQLLAVETARDVPSRFARLQRRFGRWGLAYLESLLRVADYAASSDPTEVKQ